MTNERHVLKTFMGQAHDAPGVLNEVEVYKTARKLQGNVLPTLIRAGTFYTVWVRTMFPGCLADAAASCLVCENDQARS